MFDRKRFVNKRSKTNGADGKMLDHEPREPEPRDAAPADLRADRALYTGLRDLPMPDASADFEARILAALAPCPPFWQTAWHAALRPALPAALCTLAGMLLLLRQVQQTPLEVPALQSAAIVRDAAQHRQQAEARGGANREPASEAMDNIDLNSTALSFLSRPMRRTPVKPG